MTRAQCSSIGARSTRALALLRRSDGRGRQRRSWSLTRPRWVLLRDHRRPIDLGDSRSGGRLDRGRDALVRPPVDQRLPGGLASREPRGGGCGCGAAGRRRKRRSTARSRSSTTSTPTSPGWRSTSSASCSSAWATWTPRTAFRDAHALGTDPHPPALLRFARGDRGGAPRDPPRARRSAGNRLRLARAAARAGGDRARRRGGRRGESGCARARRDRRGIPLGDDEGLGRSRDGRGCARGKRTTAPPHWRTFAARPGSRTRSRRLTTRLAPGCSWRRRSTRTATRRGRSPSCGPRTRRSSGSAPRATPASRRRRWGRRDRGTQDRSLPADLPLPTSSDSHCLSSFRGDRRRGVAEPGSLGTTAGPCPPRSLRRPRRRGSRPCRGRCFFVAFPDPQSAAQCAIAIQPRPADHRRTGSRLSHRGFPAPGSTRPRILQQGGGSYWGKGVHEARSVELPLGRGDPRKQGDGGSSSDIGSLEATAGAWS